MRGLLISRRGKSDSVRLAASSLQTFKSIFHSINLCSISAHNVFLTPVWDLRRSYVLTCVAPTQVSFGVVLAAMSGLRIGMS